MGIIQSGGGGGAIVVSPRGASVDRGPELQDLIGTWAGSRPIVLEAGLYRFDTTPRVTSSNSFVTFAPGCTIDLQTGQRGSQLPPYRALWSISQQDAPVDTTTLAAAVPPGQAWCMTAGTLATGGALAKGAGLILQDKDDSHATAAYDVTGGMALSGAIAGEGPYSGTIVITPFGGSPFTTTLSATDGNDVHTAVNSATGNAGRITATLAGFTTGRMTLASTVGPFTVSGTACASLGITVGLGVALDRPTIYDGAARAGFPTGSYVAKVIPVRNSHIDGGGAIVLAGSVSERLATFDTAVDCSIRNFVVADASGFSENVVSSDQGSRRSLLEGITLIGGTTPGVCMEATEGGTIRRCRVIGGPLVVNGGRNPAFYIQGQSSSITLENCIGAGRRGLSGAGLRLEYGVRRVTVIGGTFDANLHGVDVLDTSTGLSLHGTEILNNDGDGISSVGGVTMHGGTITGSGGYGVAVTGVAAVGHSYGTTFVSNTSGSKNEASSGTWAIG